MQDAPAPNCLDWPLPISVHSIWLYSPSNICKMSFLHFLVGLHSVSNLFASFYHLCIVFCPLTNMRTVALHIASPLLGSPSIKKVAMLWTFSLAPLAPNHPCIYGHGGLFSISINQHQSASININQLRSTSISINQHQSKTWFGSTVAHYSVKSSCLDTI